MDAKKTGMIIAVRRRELGYTQKELADKLHVSDKAVSRWETGKGFPEISILEDLSRVLELSLDEILYGEERPEQSGKDIFWRTGSQLDGGERTRGSGRMALPIEEKIELERYIQPVTTTERENWKSLTFRRFLARFLDLAIYGLCCYFILFVVLHRFPPEDIWMEYAIGYLPVLVMLAAEPFLLHWFGTTPGKWLLGISVNTFNGRRLSIREGWERTIKMSLIGLGLCLPVLSLICQGRSFILARRNEYLYWEMGSRIEDKRANAFRVLLAFAGIAVCTAGMLCALRFSVMPVYRGEKLNEQQLQMNYERYLQRYKINNAPTLHARTEDGRITEVTFQLRDFDWGNSADYDSIVQCALMAYVGAQKEMEYKDFMNIRWYSLVGQDIQFYFEKAGIEVHLEGDLKGEGGTALFVMKYIPESERPVAE